MHRSNKNQLATQIDQLAENVITRGVYVVDRKSNTIQIVEYLKQQVVLKDLPSADMANQICDVLNKIQRKRAPNFNQTQNLIDHCNRLISDTVFYRHTITVTRDEFKKQVVSARLDHALQTIKYMSSQINKSLQ